MKFFENFDNFFQNFEWITRLVQLASLAGRSGLLGTWGLLLLAHFPRPPPLGAYVKTFRHLHLWPQKPFPTSAPTFCGFRKAGERRYGSEGEIIIVESGVLGESETPSGDLLGYRDSQFWLIQRIDSSSWFYFFVIFFGYLLGYSLNYLWFFCKFIKIILVLLFFIAFCCFFFILLKALELLGCGWQVVKPGFTCFLLGKRDREIQNLNFALSISTSKQAFFVEVKQKKSNQTLYQF